MYLCNIFLSTGDVFTLFFLLQNSLALSVSMLYSIYLASMVVVV